MLKFSSLAASFDLGLASPKKKKMELLLKNALNSHMNEIQKGF